MENILYSMASYIRDMGKAIVRNPVKSSLTGLALLLGGCAGNGEQTPIPTHRNERIKECNKHIYNHNKSVCHRRAIRETGSLTFIELRINDMPIYATLPEVGYAIRRREEHLS